MMNLQKYPRTFHLPISPGISSDDKVHKDISIFNNKDVVVTLKMDGQNTSIYNNYLHARSLDSTNHPSKNWIKQFASEKIFRNLPDGWRICGENLFAKHSIHYQDLKSYFYAFSIWNQNNIALGWDESIEWFELLGLEYVPVIYRGQYDLDAIAKAFQPYKYNHEGFVIRLSTAIEYDQFNISFAKYVRANHVQPNAEHWMYQKIIPNNLMD